MKERKPSKEEIQDLHQLEYDGFEFLIGNTDISFDDSKNSKEIIAHLKISVNNVRDGAPLPSQYAKDMEQLAYALGSLWGWQLVNLKAWEWVYLDNGKGFESWGVVDSKRQFACFPHDMLFKLLKTDQENNLALLFNMIVADRLPPSADKKYLRLE